ncbi:MAG TPA: glycolate oxidase subunit GlcF [Rhodocyclaceae bacterium]|nr:glycolate oxidase subunit GlcF [Rhodocyclaceae bacterium]
METRLADWIRDTADGQEAEAVIRSCVHCGFCTATCPTYQLLGDELDGPRGRIYLIKQLLEGREATAKTQLHLDRCLTCRACETTCPSGVKYHRLLDIGRHVLSERLPRPPGQRLVRRLLAAGLTRPRLFAAAVRLGLFLRPLLPAALGDKLPAGERGRPGRASAPPAPPPATRRVLLLAGCVQPALAPSINQATRQVLAALGIDAIEAPHAGCCGALRHHLDQQDAALDDMRRLIDHWWPFIHNGAVEAIIVTASGCGAQLKDYGQLLRHDPHYAAKAVRVSELCRDVGDYLGEQAAALNGLLQQTAAPTPATRVAVHTPCTLQHAMQRRGDIERLLRSAGYALTPVGETHLCCGSAGTYSLLQPALAKTLRDRKLDALLSGAGPADATGREIGQYSRSPQVIVSANIGCLSHLQSGTNLPVRHWIELVADRLA